MLPAPDELTFAVFLDAASMKPEAITDKIERKYIKGVQRL
jgi:hypothetical protein